MSVTAFTEKIVIPAHCALHKSTKVAGKNTSTHLDAPERCIVARYI